MPQLMRIFQPLCPDHGNAITGEVATSKLFCNLDLNTIAKRTTKQLANLASKVLNSILPGKPIQGQQETSQKAHKSNSLLAIP